MNHPFMTAIDERLVRRGVAVARFNFPYMERGRRAPDRARILEQCYRTVVDQLRCDRRLNPSRIVLGGKSMGGRIATHIVAAGYPADAIFLLGYPLHPAGKPDVMRRDHLAALRMPLLFVQGTRDSLCNLEDLRSTLEKIPAPGTVCVIEGGDHSFNVLKRMRRSHESVLDEIADAGAAWIRDLPAARIGR